MSNADDLSKKVDDFVEELSRNNPDIPERAISRALESKADELREKDSEKWDKP